MCRVFAIAIILLFPLIARAEEQAKNYKEIVVIVRVNKESGDVNISISRGSEDAVVSENKHSRRRGK